MTTALFTTTNLRNLRVCYLTDGQL